MPKEDKIQHRQESKKPGKGECENSYKGRKYEIAKKKTENMKCTKRS